MTDDVAPARPAYVPSGYKFFRTIVGDEASGFWGVRRQAATVYVRGAETMYPLVAHVAREQGARLVGTEGRDGLGIDLGADGATAVYHDGWWAPGRGPDEQRAGELFIHWDRADAHSITVNAGDRVFAVRGARSKGVSLDELVKVARSLPIRGRAAER